MVAVVRGAEGEGRAAEGGVQGVFLSPWLLAAIPVLSPLGDVTWQEVRSPAHLWLSRAFSADARGLGCLETAGGERGTGAPGFWW